MSRSFFDFFPTPKFLEMPSPGLSLSDNGIRFIEFAKSRHGLVLKRFDFAPFATPLIVSGVIQNSELLVNELKAFRDKHNLRYIRTSLPEERAYLFTTEIASAQIDHIRTAIEFSIEENVPLSVSESVFDYTKIEQKSLDSKKDLRVSVSVFPEQVVREYLDAFRSAGFEPMHFEIESQAIAKAVIGIDDHSTNIILHVGSEKIGLYMCEGRTVVFTSTVPVTPLGIEGTSENKTFEEIHNELEKIFLYWQTQADKRGVRPDPVNSIILVGKGAGYPGLKDFVTKKTALTVDFANVWQNAFSVDSYVPDISRDESIKYATAIGLALPNQIS